MSSHSAGAKRFVSYAMPPVAAETVYALLKDAASRSLVLDALEAEMDIDPHVALAAAPALS